jgi:hypothetical protein
VSSGILEPAVRDVFVVSVLIAVVLLVVAFVMPTRVEEPEEPVVAEAPEVALD